MYEWITIDMTETGWTQNIGEANRNSALDKRYDQVYSRSTGNPPNQTLTKATHTRANVCENEWDPWELRRSSHVVDNGRSIWPSRRKA